MWARVILLGLVSAPVCMRVSAPVCMCVRMSLGCKAGNKECAHACVRVRARTRVYLLARVRTPMEPLYVQECGCVCVCVCKQEPEGGTLIENSNYTEATE